MLEKAFHWLTGCVRFQVKGDAARFFNISAKSGLALWGFSKEGELPAAWARPRDYRKLRRVCRRCNTRTWLLKKRGLPFQTRRFWRRKGLVLGCFAGIALYFFLSGFVWNVTVTGAERLTEAQILEAAQEAGVFVGAAQKSFRPKRAALSMLEQVKELSWVSVNTNGCFVEIALKESQEKPEVVDDEKLSNIVATREGKVIAMEAHHGRPEVELGETVQEGQLLISGLYPEKVDPYSPPPGTPMTTYGSARGSVVAETYREFTVRVSESRTEREPTGKKQVNRSLTLFGFRIPLGFNIIPQEECRLFTERFAFSALDAELPLVFEQDIYEYLGDSKRRLSEAEQKESALLKLREAQRAALPSGARIVTEKLEYAFSQGECILLAKCRCEEEIGREQPVIVE